MIKDTKFSTGIAAVSRRYGNCDRLQLGVTRMHLLSGYLRQRTIEPVRCLDGSKCNLGLNSTQYESAQRTEIQSANRKGCSRTGIGNTS
ncbi:hypothetical protein, partial [uncultured Tateyamaria sp.]|uniref:hypothetical protein n=1 Tax=uncultured Tateyamaria sp. TaxID=455651 RepID=UPI002619F7D4